MPSKAFSQIQTSDRITNQIQNNVAAAINPLLKNPQTTGLTLKSVSLTTGANTISHGLGQNLTGWLIVRQRGAASFYDSQDSNNNPSKTLILNSSASVIVDLYVY